MSQSSYALLTEQDRDTDHESPDVSRAGANQFGKRANP
jgi:hypothetical protein